MDRPCNLQLKHLEISILNYSCTCVDIMAVVSPKLGFCRARWQRRKTTLLKLSQCNSMECSVNNHWVYIVTITCTLHYIASNFNVNYFVVFLHALTKMWWDAGADSRTVMECSCQCLSCRIHRGFQTDCHLCISPMFYYITPHLFLLLVAKIVLSLRIHICTIHIMWDTLN